jgi:hypothetical protein
MNNNKVQGLPCSPPPGGPKCVRDAVAYVASLLAPLGPDWQAVDDEPFEPDLGEDEEADEESLAEQVLEDERERLRFELHGLRRVTGELVLSMPHPDRAGGVSTTTLYVRSIRPRTTSITYRDIYNEVVRAVGVVILNNANSGERLS